MLPELILLLFIGVNDGTNAERCDEEGEGCALENEMANSEPKPNVVTTGGSRHLELCEAIPY